MLLNSLRRLESEITHELNPKLGPRQVQVSSSSVEGPTTLISLFAESQCVTSDFYVRTFIASRSEGVC